MLVLSLMSFIPIVAAVIFLFFLIFVVVSTLYKKCPSDKILVKYGSTGAEKSAKCIHGGGTVVIPIFQGYEFLDLTPISIDVDLRGALSKQNIRVDVPSRFTVGISPEEGVMQNAAERLLGLAMEDIRNLAYDIIVGQMRLVIATMDIEEINTDRDKFVDNVFKNVGIELRKIGLTLINVNVTDIQDDSGYIEALGKEAAAKAINDARQSVAEKNRDGSIGEANAVQEQRVRVADITALAKVGEAEAEAKAIEGENLSKVTIAQSDADRKEKEAEAQKRATAAENVQKAKALEESYLAEKEAELARAAKERATKEADIIVEAEIDKKKVEIDAEAQAEKTRRIAKGQADATFLEQEAEARALYEVLSKQAEGLEQLVKASGGNARDAVLLQIVDKLPELVKTQADAIKNIKIDKVTVWDSGNGGKEGEGNSTSNFINGLYKSVPPLTDIFNMAGMELPEYLGKKQEDNSSDAIEAEEVTEK